MEALDAFMRGAGFDARLSRSIEYEMWEKWTLLATVGGITCLMRGNIGEVVAAPGGASFIRSFLDEVVSVVSAAGQAPKAAFVENTRTTLTTPGKTWKSSAALIAPAHAASFLLSSMLTHRSPSPSGIGTALAPHPSKLVRIG